MLIFLEWIATLTTLAGAFLTSLRYDPWNIYVLNVGSFLWLLWSTLERRLSIALVNGGMLAIYIFGIFYVTS
jgi:hypothetical protein